MTHTPPVKHRFTHMQRHRYIHSGTCVLHTPFIDTQGHMKQKALPAGTAWALGGGVKEIKQVYWEACAYGQRASFISIFTVLNKRWACGKHLQQNALVKCIHFMRHACQTSFPKQPDWKVECVILHVHLMLFFIQYKWGPMKECWWHTHYKTLFTSFSLLYTNTHTSTPSHTHTPVGMIPKEY